MDTALLLVDIQKDYFPNGRMEAVGAVEASRAARTLLVHFRKSNLAVVHIRHISTRAGASFLLAKTDGIDFHEDVMPLPGETVIEKHFPNSFKDTGLQEYLVSCGITDLVICGMMSHMCIDATVRAAFDKGYQCMVAHDACASRDMVFDGAEISAAHVHGAFMAALSAVFAKVATAEQIIGMMKGEEEL